MPRTTPAEAGWKLIRTCALSAASLFAVVSADAQAGENIVRAAHCIGVNEALLAKWSPPSKLDEEWDRLDPGSEGKAVLRSAKLRDNIERLTAYVDLNATKGERKSIEVAKNRGHVDQSATSRDIAACYSSCQQSSACFGNCMDTSPALKRVRACQKLDWLPF